MAGSGAEILGTMLTWGTPVCPEANYLVPQPGGMQYIPMADVVEDEDEEIDVVGFPEEQCQVVVQSHIDFEEILVVGRPDYPDKELLKHVDLSGPADEEIDPLSAPEPSCKKEKKNEDEQDTTRYCVEVKHQYLQRKELGRSAVDEMRVTSASAEYSLESSQDHSTEPSSDLVPQRSAEPLVQSSADASASVSNHVQVESGSDTFIQGGKQKKRFPCSICGRIYAKAASLERHQVVHQPPELPCSMCDRKFIKSCALKRHERFHQMSLTRCQLCGKQLSTANNKTLLNHLRTHMGQQKHRCFDCGRSFDLTTALLRHRRTEHGAQMDGSVTVG